MKLGIFFVMLLAGSVSSLVMGMGMIVISPLGILGIVFGTVGMVSYFVLCLVGSKLFDVDISMEKIE